MSKQKIISSKKSKACIGRLSHRITINKREVTYQSSQSVYSFTPVWTVWADIITKSGLKQFNGINIEDISSHIFIVRKISDLTSEYWINYNDSNYRILSVETVNAGVHNKVHCRLTGEDDLDGSDS